MVAAENVCSKCFVCTVHHASVQTTEHRQHSPRYASIWFHLRHEEVHGMPLAPSSWLL
jgi:hypothetical protein